MLIYKVIEGSEINCEVEMDEDGLVQKLEPIDADEPFGFAWMECPEGYENEKQCESHVWDSRDMESITEFLYQYTSIDAAIDDMEKYLPKEAFEEIKKFLQDEEEQDDDIIQPMI